jgi:uncharacterized protein (TIGR00255 family)
MTGYGRGQTVGEGKTITVELRSVNNRYFDCTVRAPKMYTFLEEPIKSTILKSGVSRGKVEVFINIEYASGTDTMVTVNDVLAKNYFDAFLHLSETLSLPNDLTVSNLARQPEVLTITKVEEDRDALLQDVLHALNEALVAYNAMRKTEGARLAADIREKSAKLEAQLSEVEARMPEVVSEYYDRLLQKMQEILQDARVDETRLVTEAALFADRVATDEETVRLRSHLVQLDSILQEGGPVGRKLDFLLQEMNREVNTIGSKAGDLTVTKLIVDMKSDLEKIREQIQNLE